MLGWPTRRRALASLAGPVQNIRFPSAAVATALPARIRLPVALSASDRPG